MILTKRGITSGEKLPKGYRIAYWDMPRVCIVAYPIGIHWIVMAAHRVWEWTFCYSSTKLEKALRQVYTMGKERGYEECLMEHTWLRAPNREEVDD